MVTPFSGTVAAQVSVCAYACKYNITYFLKSTGRSQLWAAKYPQIKLPSTGPTGNNSQLTSHAQQDAEVVNCGISLRFASSRKL
ncbi:hypothetical protein E2C01_077025 [Portunus trituberculatus]|uniref:Uncharacterized protein n=1 Tax=Portunus trituberculatus TaxID=210409 RepID=A0A5B7IQ75_PORTR|nr:hypothetical protein [Portunus trituberculatus]